jgi:hypothetical protein
MPQKSALLPEEKKIPRDDPRLLNASDLARVLGVNRAYITRLKKYGFKMPMGRATISMALEFIESNADVLGA